MSVGVDLIEIDRIEAALVRRPRLAERLFVATELEYAGTRARPARHLAARFAAKEAVSKALAVDLRPLEIVVEGNAPPRARLSGITAQAARSQGLEVAISIAHSRTVATAVALAHSAAPAGA